jgi:cytochrome c553
MRATAFARRSGPPGSAFRSKNHAMRWFLAVAVALVGAASALANPAFIDLRRIAAVHGDAAAGAAGAAVCVGCHGPAGISPVPAFPSLAGQKIAYLYQALVAFQRGERADSPMAAQAASLSDEDMANLAAYYAGLAPPEPAPAGKDVALARQGAAIYLHGDAARGIPPCQGCHGTDARGHPLASRVARYAAYPRLRGQHADYLAQRLADLAAGKYRLTSNDRIMEVIAGRLDDGSRRALAAWLAAPDTVNSR